MINISVVVPVYKEELSIRLFLARIEKVFTKISGFTSFKDEENIPDLPVGKENLFTP